MKKDFRRDYAKNAFRLWGKFGEPSPEEAARLMLTGEITQKELCDFEACFAVFDALRNEEKEYIISAVRAVYLTENGREIEKRDISMRVVAFSLSLHADERTVYRYLSSARKLFWRFRGGIAAN